MNLAIICNIIIIIFVLIGLYLSIKKYSFSSFIFYTVISNCFGLLSAVVFLLNIEGSEKVRFFANVLLMFTFLVTLFVLVPLGSDLKEMMFKGSGLCHHLIVPITSIVSYLLWEKHYYSPWQPVVFTFFYGIIVYYLNWIRKVDGPYPFFKIHKIGVKKSAIWFFTLLFSIFVLAQTLIYLSILFEK